MGYCWKNRFALPGNNVRQSLYEAEWEENRKRQAEKREAKAEQNKENMLIFVKHLHQAFDGTEVQKRIEDLINTWSTHRFNKEVYLANIMVCNVIKESPASERLISLWEGQLMAFCKENGFQYERFYMNK